MGSAEGRPPAVRTGGILALDCGHSFGWAYAFPGAEPLYGTVILPKPNGKGYTIFRRWLHERIVEYRPRLICVEAPILNHFGLNKTSLQTAEWLLGLHAHVVQISHHEGIRCESARATKVKLFLTNDGRAKKPEMISAIEDMGWSPQTSDEADALATLMWAEARFAPRIQRIKAMGPLFNAR